MKCP